MQSRFLIAGGLLMATSAIWSTACSSPTSPPGAGTPGPTITCPAGPGSVTSVSGGPTPVSFGVATSTGGTAPVTIVCSPASGSLFPVGSTTVTCTATDASQKTSSCTVDVTVTTPPVLTVTRFVAFGDSITWGEDGDTGPGSILIANPRRNRPAVQFPFSQTYPGALQQELAARYTQQTPTVDNAGCPGEFVTEYGPCGNPQTRFSGLMASGRYDAVLIMEGTNDLGDRDAAIDPAVIDGLHQMVSDAKSRGIRPYLATLPPMNPKGSRGLAWSLIAPFNDQVRSLAASDGVTLVDVFAALNTDVDTMVGPDGLHLSAAGYLKTADTFMAAIKATAEAPVGQAATFFLRGRASTPRRVR